MKNRRLQILFIMLILGLGFSSLYAQGTSKEIESLFVARKAYDDGFYDVSLGLLERFLKAYPNSSRLPEARLLIGQCYFNQGKFLDALEKFEEVASDHKAKDIKDSAYYWIGEVHFKGNNFDKAATYYKRIIGEYPGSSYLALAYYSIGWCSFQNGEFRDALEFFKIVEEKYPEEPQAKDASFKIIECLYSLKDYATLQEKLKSYIKIYARDEYHLGYLYFYMAEADYYLDNFTQAIDAYSKVIDKIKDEKIHALSELGISWSYLKLKKYKESEASFAKVKRGLLEKQSLDVFLLGKAILMTETERMVEAKNIYRELLETTSEPLVSVQAYLGYADALYNLAEYLEATKIYEQALAKTNLKVAPQEIIDKLHYNLAWAYLKGGEFKKAIGEFQKIVKNSEDKIVKISALCQIGDTYQDSGDYKKAQETYDSILKDYPDSFYSDYVQYQLGLTLLKISNYDGAILSLLSLKNNFPNSKLLDDATYALGLAYFQRQDYNSSKDVFAGFEEEFKDSNLKPQVLYLLGTSLYNLGSYPQAIGAFKNIIRIYSQDQELVQKAEYEIADCYYQMGDEKEAMVRFEALRSKYPDSSLSDEIMWWLGEYYYRHSNLTMARRYFSSLIQDFPKSNLVNDAYYILGSSYAEDAKYEEAIKNFNKVIDAGKSDLAGQAAIAIADIYVKEDKTDLAFKEYDKVLELYPNLTNLIYPKKAELFYRLNQYDQAIDYYRKSLDLVQVRDMPKIQLHIAEVFQAQRKYSEAIEEYLKVTYLYSENDLLAIRALLRVAEIYEGKENFKEALNIYQRIIDMDAEEAKYARERINLIKTSIR
ncbi:MAG: tetratricopeptide repeat protein [Candidatus Omnitrophota bacterium]